jgi:uncharacterized protein (TIGR02145 family)
MRIIYIPRKVSGFTGIKYGALYNWWASVDSRNITSSNDWTILSDTQWGSLISYLGGSTVAGGKMKETGTTYWISPNTGATNEVGFNARGASQRDNSGNFITPANGMTLYHAPLTSVKYIYLNYNSDDCLTLSYSDSYKVTGASIRLIYTGSGTPTSYTGNDGKVYRVVTINGVTYLADNLAETKFRNGDWITGYDGGTYTPISNAVWAAKTTEAMCIYGNIESNMLL